MLKYRQMTETNWGAPCAQKDTPTYHFGQSGMNPKRMSESAWISLAAAERRRPARTEADLIVIIHR